MAEKTTVVNIRLPELQARWLKQLAELEHGGNVSAAARKAFSDAWMMRRAREEYAEMTKHEGFEIPRDEDGMSRGIEFFLSSLGAKADLRWTEEDLEVI